MLALAFNPNVWDYPSVLTQFCNPPLSAMATESETQGYPAMFEIVKRNKDSLRLVVDVARDFVLEG